MKFTLSHLKEYLETASSLEEICHKLNNIGLEVEEVSDQAKNLAPFFVAQIVNALPHPDSTKLQICQVDVGGKELLQVICGAKNARSGLKVAFAPIGSTIPGNGMVIKKAKIAGVESNGMLCSAAELGLGVDGEGIIEINEKFAIGTKIAQIFGLSDAVIEINVTPNRGDCLGVLGIARDLAASGLGALRMPEIKAVNGNFSSPISAKIESENCGYFSGCYIKNVKNQPSPKWLQDRLLAVGQNPISAIVDITNYVMLSLNQPLHSYDAGKIEGNIYARNTDKDENFTSLKNENYQLSGEELVIADDKKIVGLAGIIGGASTTIDENTQNIFLEAAYFNPQNIAKTGRKLNILSDARYRFEREIDKTGTKKALEMAVNLVLEICGGETSQIIEVGNCQPKNHIINFDLNKIKQILGINLTSPSLRGGEADVAIQILQNLGFIIQKSENILQIQVPSHRNDVKIAEDLVEEIIRIHGLNHIKPQALDNSQNSANNADPLDLIRTKLCGNGLTETINWSFIDQNLAEIFTEPKAELQILNPIAKQMNLMRPNLLIGLLQNAAKNQTRNFDDLAIFEIGKIFLGVKENQQKNVACALRIGKNKNANHYKDERNFDVFDVKKDLFDCLQTLGFSASSFQFENAAPNHYHQFRCATLKLGKNTVAHFGELHPAIAKKFDVKGKVNIFELFIDDLPINLNKKSAKKAFAVSDFQAVNRDFAFVLEDKIAVGDVLKKVSEVEKSLITEVNLFDIYKGEKLGKDKKSIAFGVTIQPTEKTLTGEEIEAIAQKIIQKVSADFGGVLRE